MDRIISDCYSKNKKTLWGDDLSDPFNQKITAVNNMYAWLFDQGILEQVSFEFKNYSDAAYFAFDVKDLETYREKMLQSGAEGADLAVHHIFDEPYTPCMYSGAIELGWTMFTYRDVDGCVGSSWECALVKSLSTESAQEIHQTQMQKGIKEAVRAMFSAYEWEPSIPTRKPVLDAVIHAASPECNQVLPGKSTPLVSPER